MGIAGRGAGEAEPSAALVASGVRQPVEVVDVQADVIRRCPPLLLTHYLECVAILEPVAKVSYQCISVLYGEPGAVDMEGETCDPA